MSVKSPIQADIDPSSADSRVYDAEVVLANIDRFLQCTRELIAEADNAVVAAMRADVERSRQRVSGGIGDAWDAVKIRVFGAALDEVPWLGHFLPSAQELMEIVRSGDGVDWRTLRKQLFGKRRLARCA